MVWNVFVSVQLEEAGELAGPAVEQVNLSLLVTACNRSAIAGIHNFLSTHFLGKFLLNYHYTVRFRCLFIRKGKSNFVLVIANF